MGVMNRAPPNPSMPTQGQPQGMPQQNPSMPQATSMMGGMMPVGQMSPGPMIHPNAPMMTPGPMMRPAMQPMGQPINPQMLPRQMVGQALQRRTY